MDFQAQSPDAPARYLITADQYGQFLCEAFDVWYDDGAPGMSVRFFDDMLGVHIGREAGLCTHGRRCSQTLVLEKNGDAFPCDFYMSMERRLGNISLDSLRDLVGRPAYRQFLRLKETLPEACTRCNYLRLCFGGCPAIGFGTAGDAPPDPITSVTPTADSSVMPRNGWHCSQKDCVHNGSANTPVPVFHGPNEMRHAFAAAGQSSNAAADHCAMTGSIPWADI